MARPVRRRSPSSRRTPRSRDFLSVPVQGGGRRDDGPRLLTQGLEQDSPPGTVAPFPLATKPNTVEAPAAIVPLYDAFLTLIVPVGAELTPFQRLLMD